MNKQTLTRDEFHANPAAAMRRARRDDGITITDGDGKPRMQIVIPRGVNPMREYVQNEMLDFLPYAKAKAAVVAAFNAAYVALLLEATKGNKTQAAKRAKVDRSGWRRIERKVGKPTA